MMDPSLPPDLVPSLPSGDPETSPLAMSLLPLSATDASCRAAIMGHAKVLHACMGFQDACMGS